MSIQEWRFHFNGLLKKNERQSGALKALADRIPCQLLLADRQLAVGGIVQTIESLHLKRPGHSRTQQGAVGLRSAANISGSAVSSQLLLLTNAPAESSRLSKTAVLWSIVFLLAVAIHCAALAFDLSMAATSTDYSLCVFHGTTLIAHLVGVYGGLTRDTFLMTVGIVFCWIEAFHAVLVLSTGWHCIMLTTAIAVYYSGRKYRSVLMSDWIMLH